jgi:large subunit ribosomal protein L28
MSKCDVCGKMNNNSRKYRYRGSFVTKRVPSLQKPNVRKMKIIENGVSKKILICMRCVRADKLTRAV